MLQISDLGEIKSRASALGVSLKRLAAAAGVDPSTIYRAARAAGDTRVSTLRRLNEHLAAREIDAARHLLGLPHVRAALDAPAEQSEAA